MALNQPIVPPRERPVILVVCDYYLPGYESGGAMRTLVNMVDRLSDEFDFRIITRDHDGPLNRAPYQNVRIGEWNRIGNADVYYLSRNNIRPGRLRSLIVEVAPQAVYLNSFFSPLTITVLSLRRTRRIGRIPLVLAPEGEFSAGALTLKPLKKQLYIRTAKLLGTLGTMVWKAAAQSERSDIVRVLGGPREIFIAPNLPPVTMADAFDPVVRPPKAPGAVKMVFLSRFMRKKNFNWLLEHLSGVNGELTIDICGPIEDADYWEEAKRLIASLPPDVKITAKGPVPHTEVASTLANYHFFILPTLGENFGHVFIEALAAGCPTITSDRTPWRQLDEKGIGWDLPLEKPDAWVGVLNKCIEMGPDDYEAFSRKARNYALEWLSDPALEESNRIVLRSAVEKSGK